MYKNIPQTGGLVEQFNGTQKSMMKKFTSSKQNDWKNVSLISYLPIEKLYKNQQSMYHLSGRHVRVPLESIRESWTGEKPEEPTTLESLSQVGARLDEMTKIVETNIKKAQRKQKYHYHKKAKDCTLEVGDEVLIQVPSKPSKLKLKWERPYKITNIQLIMRCKHLAVRRKKVYHVKILKKWNAGMKSTSCATWL